MGRDFSSSSFNFDPSRNVWGREGRIGIVLRITFGRLLFVREDRKAVSFFFSFSSNLTSNVNGFLRYVTRYNSLSLSKLSRNASREKLYSQNLLSFNVLLPFYLTVPLKLSPRKINFRIRRKSTRQREQGGSGEGGGWRGKLAFLRRDRSKREEGGRRSPLLSEKTEKPHIGISELCIQGGEGGGVSRPS